MSMEPTPPKVTGSSGLTSYRRLRTTWVAADIFRALDDSS